MIPALRPILFSGLKLPQLPGLAAWYRFGLGITSSGGAVSQWDDQSGNGRHLKQATATNQPALQGDGSILFDGVDNYLKADTFTLAQPETVFILGKQPTWTNTDKWADGHATNSGSISQESVTPQIACFAGAGGLVGPGLALDTYGVVIAVFNTTSSLIQINTNAPVTGNVGVNSMSGFTLGARGGADAAWSNIQVKEVLIYSVAHDAAARAQVARYLGFVGRIGV
jgi:hypothetical protein